MMSLLFRPDMDAGEVFVNFNQNVTSLAVGTKSGYSLYSLGSVDNTLDKIYTCPTEEIFLIERLFESSLVAIVAQRAPRKLKVCHFKKQSEICNYSYSNSILAVKLNRERLIVCLEESLYIHNIQDMKVVHTIRDTPCNSAGLCALSSSSDHCYLAYPGSVTAGEVQIFDAINLHAKTMIPAHDSPLAALAFSPSGTEIATASERGTVIRVFSFNPFISAACPGESWLKVRPLKDGDYDRGFLQLLSQLTHVGPVSRTQFLTRFSQMKASGDYFVTVIEDTRKNEIIGAASLIIERKFIHNCAIRGRLEDVVVNDTYRGKQLGKLIVVTVSLLAQYLGCYKMSLDCKDKLIKFYETLGYVLIPGNSNSMTIRYDESPVVKQNLTAFNGAGSDACQTVSLDFNS